MPRWFVACLLAATVATGPAVAQQPLSADAAFERDQVVSRYEPLTIAFNRLLRPDDGRLAVFIGDTDYTSLFSLRQTVLRYEPELLPLPSGDTEVIVYLVGPANTWREVARFPLRVRLRADFDAASLEPSLTLTNEGQVAHQQTPAPPEPDPRATYQDVTGQLNVASELKHSGWTVHLQATAVGVTFEEKALRYRDKGPDAPAIDLSSYLATAERDGLQLRVGHIAHGQHRYLINNYGSRGVTVALDRSAVIDASVAVMNGTRIVGWSHPFGLANPDHRMVSGTVGFNLLADQPGQVRLEASYLDGAKEPRAGFNQAGVLDAERSRGFGLRLLAATPGRRLHLEGGVARSQYTNPADPAIAPAADLVPLRRARGLAHYVDASVRLLDNLALHPNHRASLQATFRRERIDPQYRTLAAFLRPDLLQNAVEVQGMLSALTAQMSRTWSADNLDEIASILTTKTRQLQTALNLTPAQLAPRAPAAVRSLLPRLGYSYAHTHQFGTDVPVDGGFNASHIPDQVSRTHNADAGWQGRHWRASIRFGHAHQDNRQEGRADADFTNRTQSLALDLSPAGWLSLGADLTFDRALSHADTSIDRTRRLGVRLRLQPVPGLALSAAYSPTRTTDADALRRRVNRTASADLSYRIALWPSGPRPVRGQVFVRYSRFDARTLDPRFDVDTETSTWTVNTGVSVSL